MHYISLQGAWPPNTISLSEEVKCFLYAACHARRCRIRDSSADCTHHPHSILAQYTIEERRCQITRWTITMERSSKGGKKRHIFLHSLVAPLQPLAPGNGARGQKTGREKNKSKRPIHPDSKPPSPFPSFHPDQSTSVPHPAIRDKSDLLPSSITSIPRSIRLCVHLFEPNRLGRVG